MANKLNNYKFMTFTTLESVITKHQGTGNNFWDSITLYKTFDLSYSSYKYQPNYVKWNKTAKLR